MRAGAAAMWRSPRRLKITARWPAPSWIIGASANCPSTSVAMRRTVDTYLHLPRRRYFSAIELHAVAIGSIAAVVLLIGYGFNFTPLQTLIPGFPAMAPITAGLIMALSLSCLLSLRGSQRLTWLSAA